LQYEQHVREMIVGLFLLLGFRPLLAECRSCRFHERIPFAVAFEPKLVIGDEIALGAIAEARLDEAKHGGVDVLVIARDTSDVEDYGDRFYPVGESVPRIGELLVSRRIVPAEKRRPEGSSIWQDDAVEGEAEELGEAGFARAVETGDPRC